MHIFELSFSLYFLKLSGSTEQNGFQNRRWILFSLEMIIPNDCNCFRSKDFLKIGRLVNLLTIISNDNWILNMNRVPFVDPTS